MVRRKEELLPIELHPLFIRLVKQGFSQRRKMMMKLLKECWSSDELSEAFRQVGIPETIRAEAVTLEQFTLLTKILAKHS